MTMRPELVRGRQPDLALRRLAGGDARSGRSSAVIDGVADHVGQRIGQPLDHGPVDLGRLAFGLQAHVLAGRVGDLAHDARHALEQRLAPAGRGSPSRFPGSRGSAVRDRPGRWRRSRAFLTSARLQHALRQHRLVDDQFADQIDQAIDAVEIDADRRRAAPPLPVRRLALAFAGSAAVGDGGGASIGSAGVGGVGEASGAAAGAGRRSSVRRRRGAAARRRRALDRLDVQLAIADRRIRTPRWIAAIVLVRSSGRAPGQIGSPSGSRASSIGTSASSHSTRSARPGATVRAADGRSRCPWRRVRARA